MNETDDFMNPAPVEKIAACGTGGETTTPEQFTIDTREKADWFLKTLLSYDAEEAKLKAEAATILAQLDAMITRNKADKDSFQGRFHQQFERFVAEQIAADRKGRKSVIFFYGTASYRTVPAQIVLESPLDAMTTARAVLPSAITTETREVFDRSAFLAYAKEQFEKNGEILPGVKRTEERETFSVKVATPKAKGDTTTKEGE